MHRLVNRSRIAFVIATAIVAAACAASNDDATTPSSATDAAPPNEVLSAVDLAEPTPPEKQTSTTSPLLTTSSSTTSSSTTTTSSTTTSSTTTSSTTTSSATIPDIACQPGGEWITTASGRRVLLRADGIDRRAPTVIVIHGFTGTPTGIERVSDMTNAVRGTGIAVAYPEGSPVAGLDGALAWTTGAGVFASTGADDIAALVEMIDALVATGCVDRSRMTISGESNGGGMTLAAICSPELARTFRTAIMVIPAVDQGVLDRCDNDIAPETALTAVAGVIDRTTPFDGGNELLAQPEWFADVAARRGCGPVAPPLPLTDWVDRMTAPGCTPCTELLAVADGPHTWPGTPVGNGNLPPGTFDLNRRIIADLLGNEPRCISEL